MNLFKACDSILTQLEFVVTSMSKADYPSQLLSLNNSTIGQHIRHTLEFFICLQRGYESGVVNYDDRERDLSIETSTSVALNCINNIREFILSDPSNRELSLEGSYSLQEEQNFTIPSNFQRELAYNIEHAIHHMAIIKIGMAETNPALELPSHFGVAISTVRYSN